MCKSKWGYSSFSITLFVKKCWNIIVQISNNQLYVCSHLVLKHVGNVKKFPYFYFVWYQWKNRWRYVNFSTVFGASLTTNRITSVHLARETVWKGLRINGFTTMKFEFEQCKGFDLYNKQIGGIVTSLHNKNHIQ